jgi:hypothetical protein
MKVLSLFALLRSLVSARNSSPELSPTTRISSWKCFRKPPPKWPATDARRLALSAATEATRPSSSTLPKQRSKRPKTTSFARSSITNRAESPLAPALHAQGLMVTLERQRSPASWHPARISSIPIVRANNSGADLNRLDLPPNVYTRIWWNVTLPNHYQGDATGATQARGHALVQLRIEGIVTAVRAIKADQMGPRLQEEFFDATTHPAETKQ